MRSNVEDLIAFQHSRATSEDPEFEEPETLEAWESTLFECRAEIGRAHRLPEWSEILESHGMAAPEFGASLLSMVRERSSAKQWHPVGVWILSDVSQSPRAAAPSAAAPRQSEPDRAKIAALEERVRKLEAQVGELLAEREPRPATVPVDPFSRWIESHPEELRRYPDAWVVLDPEKGIVFHSQDDAEFEAHIAQYGPDDRAHMTIFHTSEYP